MIPSAKSGLTVTAIIRFQRCLSSVGKQFPVARLLEPVRSRGGRGCASHGGRYAGGACGPSLSSRF